MACGVTLSRTGAAKALAAYEGRTEVTLSDIQRVIVLCLRHRLRKDPLEGIDSGYKVEKVFSQVFGVAEPTPKPPMVASQWVPGKSRELLV